MLRFRPIAPKPASGSSSSDHPAPEKIRVTRGRPKRKYSRARKNNIRNKKVDDELIDPTMAAMTLQLLPEVPNWTIGTDGGSARLEMTPPMDYFNSTVRDKRSTFGFFPDQADPTVVESSVVVESVTDVCTIKGVGLGSTDTEMIKNLELDTCPGFVSDNQYTVRWINPAYKEMTCTNGESTMSLVVKGELPVEYPAFTCRVRMQCATWRTEKGPTPRILPCDVWKMDFGGLAWRLDLTAALTLGR